MGLGVVLIVIAILFPQQILTVDSGPVHGDVIVVLGGGTDQGRPEWAAKLFKEGEAPIVLVSGYGDDQLTVRLLRQNGVPHEAIQVENASTSTLENALYSTRMLREMGARRVIIVTSWYHSRRALACFRHVAPDLQFYSRPSYSFYARSEWDRQDTRGHIRTEYVKLLAYWPLYGVWPL